MGIQDWKQWGSTAAGPSKFEWEGPESGVLGQIAQSLWVYLLNCKMEIIITEISESCNECLAPGKLSVHTLVRLWLSLMLKRHFCIGWNVEPESPCSPVQLKTCWIIPWPLMGSLCVQKANWKQQKRFSVTTQSSQWHSLLVNWKLFNLYLRALII